MSYSDEDIKELEKCPGVLNVTPRRLALKIGFKREVYEEWYTSGRNTEAVRSALEKRGFNIYCVSDRYFSDLSHSFKVDGVPARQASLTYKDREDHVELTMEKMTDSPYFNVLKNGQLELTEAFYDDAVQFLGLPVSEILAIYCIPEGRVPEAEVEKKLRAWKIKGNVFITFSLQVAKNRFIAMHKLLENELEAAKNHFKSMTPPQKKKVCEMIDKLPRDSTEEYNTQNLRKKLGISQTLYYKYLRLERYGMEKSEKKQSDIEAVRKVFEYKGFKKGSRIIYMMMPDIVGRKMGLKKIRRIMKENNMESKIRQPSEQRANMKEYVEKNRQPNLLDRAFRLFRPNQLRLSDVTYLSYGNNKRAYGSASIDPVTGKIIAFVVSAQNNQALADSTLSAMDNFPCEFCGKFHSDQGALYLMPAFQQKLKERGFEISMSRRGNCWDNAPQESFFGHFKDEARDMYSECKTLEELQKVITDYVYYFNYERRIWTRKGMTPVKYEEYLSSLSDEDFQTEYLEPEKEKYAAMKKHSDVRTKKKAMDLLASCEESGAENDD